MPILPLWIPVFTGMTGGGFVSFSLVQTFLEGPFRGNDGAERSHHLTGSGCLERRLKQGTTGRSYPKPALRGESPETERPL